MNTVVGPFPAGRVRTVGIVLLVIAFFGALWGVIGALALPGNPLPVVVLVAAVTVALLACAVRFFRLSRRLPRSSEGPGSNPFKTRAYVLSVLFEAVGIPVAAVVLNSAGYPGAVVSAVAAIVGLHFFGLIPAFGSWRFAALGGAMVFLALLSLLLPAGTGAGGNPRGAAVGLGCALLLWASVLPLIVSTWRGAGARLG